MAVIIDISEDTIKKIEKIRFLIGGKEDRELQSEIINAIKNRKSTDEMIAEIEAINDWAIRFVPTESKEKRPQIVAKVKKHIISIIYKYCDIKERKNEDIGIR